MIIDHSTLIIRPLGRSDGRNRKRRAGDRGGAAGARLQRVGSGLVYRQVAEARDPVHRADDGRATEYATGRVGRESYGDGARKRAIGAPGRIAHDDFDGWTDDLTFVRGVRLDKEPEARCRVAA